MKNLSQDFTNDIKGYLEINELLQVCVSEELHAVTYSSRINDISEGKLIIAWPTHAGIRLIVHRDQILVFNFLRNSVPHEFTGMVDDTNPQGIPQITIILTSAVSRIQRRQNFRIKCMIPLEITGSLKSAQEDSAEALHLRTTTTDLSASGLSIRNAKSIPENSLVEVKLSLPDEAPPIRIPCKVVYLTSPGDGLMLYKMGIQFLAISESERARIVRFVYRSQLKGLHP